MPTKKKIMWQEYTVCTNITIWIVVVLCYTKLYFTLCEIKNGHKETGWAVVTLDSGQATLEDRVFLSGI
jgi:hypothetical protein